MLESTCQDCIDGSVLWTFNCSLKELVWNKSKCLVVKPLSGIQLNTHVLLSSPCLERTHMFCRQVLAWNEHTCFAVKTLPGSGMNTHVLLSNPCLE